LITFRNPLLTITPEIKTVSSLLLTLKKNIIQENMPSLYRSYQFIWIHSIKPLNSLKMREFSKNWSGNTSEQNVCPIPIWCQWMQNSILLHLSVWYFRLWFLLFCSIKFIKFSFNFCSFFWISLSLSICLKFCWYSFYTKWINFRFFEDNVYHTN